MKNIGLKLKEKRIQNGLSIDEVAEDLKLRPSQIESIEEGRKDDFKDIFYLKYFIRDYAKYLGLDSDKMLDEFNEYLFDETSKIPVDMIKEAKKMFVGETYSIINISTSYKEESKDTFTFIDKLDKEYRLGTYFKNISRHKIYDIAKELPDFEKWNESSFDDVRSDLKKKYDLSSNDLCKIINIIKDSRWLSYFINYNRKDYSEIYVLLKKCFIANIDDKNDSQVSHSISMENIKENLELTQQKHKIHKEFLKELSIEQIVIIYTYYRMGHRILYPENYEGILQESKEQQFVDGKTEENINFLEVSYMDIILLIM